KALAEAALQTQLDRVAEMEWKVRRDLRDAWVSWSAKRLKIDQAQAIIEQLNLIVESTSLLSKTGEMPETEASLFLIEREARKAESNQLEAGVAEDFQRLKALVGLSPDAPIDPVPSVSGVPEPNEKEVPDNNNPTLNRLRSQYETAERAFITEVRKQYPDLTIGPQAETEEGQSRIGFIGMIPIPILNANRQGIAEANAARETARVVFETEYQRVLGRIAQLRARLKGIHDQLRTIQDNLAPLVDRQITNAHLLLKIGESNSLVLLQSLISAYEVKIMLIDLQLENSLTNNEIRFLLGPTPANSDPASSTQTP
ncbi:MAG: TolC family protein, partial [Candidatus Latescibacterota bacterium]|nr:TolC family protein [Candidatus Latescibacterota bacterium]